MFGKLLAAPFRLINSPLRAVEKMVDYTAGGESERELSTPLECIAEALEEALDGEDD